MPGSGGLATAPDQRTMGDVSHIMPALHPSMAGATGTNHATDWDIVDPQMAYIEAGQSVGVDGGGPAGRRRERRTAHRGRV